jgi:hypothetical protein
MKQQVLKVTNWLVLHWRGIAMSIIICCIALATLGLQIDNLIEGQNKFESAYVENVKQNVSFSGRMVNAPHTIPANIIGSNIDDYLLAGRIVSVIYGLFATLLLFLVLKRWYTVQIAVVGSLLFITSSWVLAISHQATAAILLVFTPLLLLAALARYVSKRRSTYASFLLLVVSLAIAAYVPYMFWVILAVLGVAIFVYHRYVLTYKNWQLVLSAGIYFTLLLPMAVSLAQYPGQLRELTGIPEQFPSITQYLSNFAEQIYSIFIFTKPFPEYFAGNLPLLDIFSASMVILGIYHFRKFMPKRRSISVFVTLILLLIIVPLSPVLKLSMTVLIPFIYIFIPSGINELLRQWFEYFPRNPLARNGAVIVIVIVISMATFYNLQRFYVAWPNAEETKASYMVQSIE